MRCSTCRPISPPASRAAGIGQFADMALCTYGDEARFFSFRRVTHRGEPDYGRLLHAIALG